ncbi:MAG TPA: DHA2 family efflux MFS transporter permease subunit, partial [Spirochaetia bacterium]|nr:DHA2 family efflux MFS transporter permease subunit [Spirochaetia bacterium]
MDSSNGGAAPHKYAILAIVLLGVFMSVIDGIVVSIALPTLTESLRVDLSLSQWAITAYLIALTSLLLVFGRVATFTGRSVLFSAGLTLFTLASVACGLSVNLTELIAFRVIQGIGGAMVFSISGAILFLTFPANERGRAMGYLGSAIAVGSIVGPVLGGFLVDTLGWRWIFLINLPIGIVLVVLALVFLPHREERGGAFRMDWIGAVSLIILVLSLVLLLSRLGDLSASPWPGLLFGALFVAATAVFLVQESRSDNPLLDLQIFGVRAFRLPIIAAMAFFAASFMMNVAGPFYFERVMGLRASQVGLLFLVVPLVMTVSAPAAGWLFDKHHRRHYGTIGLSTTALCFIALGFIVNGRQSIPAMVVVFVLLGLGSSLFQSPNSTEIMNALPRD